jgi:hypothetical protein
MVHMRILGALLAFAVIAQCRDPAAPPQPAPDPGPTDSIVAADHAAKPEPPSFEEVRL